MKKLQSLFTTILLVVTFNLISISLSAQKLYFPGTEWKTRSPGELRMNSMWLDSAVNFAQANESKTEKDLRIAILRGYGREPFFNIIGPVKPRGGPAGLVIKSGYIVAQWGDIDRVDMTFSVTKSFL